ncbi:hypothetical protein ABC195_12540 [Microbacterium sp. 2P01SA-2]|uniref:hypothetical protein n=1 Tax=unclassified Microbacterium TaxID=2609290 RepID=UPI0039A15528
MTGAAHEASSPRTTAEPFAFTRSEFWSGAGRAWLWTAFLLIAVWAISTGGIGIVAALFILPASVVALAIGAPGAYVLGRLLRRSPHVPIHLAIFAAYGVLVSVVVTAAYSLVTMTPTTGLAAVLESSWLLIVNGPVTAIGLAGAWFVTAKRARRADAGAVSIAGRSEDPDAAAEDAFDERYRVIDPGRARRQRPRG